MFDANALLKQWNEANPNKKRRIDKFLATDGTKEFIEALVDDIQVSENQPNVKNDIPKNGVDFRNVKNDIPKNGVDFRNVKNDILDDAIDIIEKATSMDIDAVFSDGDYRFSIYDNHNRVIVTTNENITHLAVERNEYQSETLYTYLREYAADYE